MSTPECIYIKWKTPEEELVGAARLCEAFTHRRINEAHELAIAVPNMAWALQAWRACAAAGIQASIRAGKVNLSAKAQSRLALVNLLAHPNDAALRAKMLAQGTSEAELDQLLSQYAGAKAAALVRLADLKACPELYHGLMHVCGDESASQLYRILQQQLETPTAPKGVQVLAIVPFTRVTETFAQMFLPGCVEGLMPSDAAARKAFVGLPQHATKRLYYSGFSTAQKEFAQRAGIAFARTKLEGDAQIAMCKPTQLFAEFGAARPSTLGGQALLRKYQLN